MKQAFLILSLIVLSLTANAQVWKQTNGPSGNKIKQIVFNQKKDMFVLSATLQKTTDRGVSWRQVGSRFGNGKIRSIAVSAVGDLYIVISPTGNASDSISGLWKSGDEGKSWKRMELNNSVVDVIASPDSSLHVLYFRGISGPAYSYRSFDQGATWDSSKVGDDNYFTASGADVNGNLFICMNTVVYRSSNKGTTWSKVYGLTIGRAHNISFAPNGDIYLSTIGQPYGLYRSVDGGLSWARRSLPDSKDQHLQGTAVSSSGRILFVGSYELLYSDDRGSSWSSYGQISNELGYQVPSIPCIADPDNGFHVVMMGCVVHVTADTFNVLTPPISTVPVLFCHSDGSIIASNMYEPHHVFNYGGIISGLWHSTSQGEVWEPLYGHGSAGNTRPSFTPTCIERDTNQTLFAFADRSIFTSDDGIVWRLNSKAPAIEGTVNAIVATPNRRLYLATTSDGMLISPDNGELWWQVNNGLSGTNVTAAAVALDNTLLAAEMNKLFRSTNNGDNWEQITSASFTGTIKILKFDMAGTLFAAVLGEGVFRSTDKGSTWQAMNAGLPNFTIAAILLANDGSTIVSTDSGVFRFTNSVWSRFNEGLTAPVLSLAQDTKGKLYAGTTSAGVFSNELPFSNVEIRSELQKITIQNPTPNPASNHLIYGFTCEETMSVSIELYEVTGKRVSMLLDKHFSPGSYSFTLSTTGLVSGTYLLSFVTSSGTQTRSIVIQ